MHNMTLYTYGPKVHDCTMFLYILICRRFDGSGRSVGWGGFVEVEELRLHFRKTDGRREGTTYRVFCCFSSRFKCFVSFLIFRKNLRRAKLHLWRLQVNRRQHLRRRCPCLHYTNTRARLSTSGRPITWVVVSVTSHTPCDTHMCAYCWSQHYNQCGLVVYVSRCDFDSRFIYLLCAYV